MAARETQMELDRQLSIRLTQDADAAFARSIAGDNTQTLSPREQSRASTDTRRTTTSTKASSTTAPSSGKVASPTSGSAQHKVSTDSQTSTSSETAPTLINLLSSGADDDDTSSSKSNSPDNALQKHCPGWTPAVSSDADAARANALQDTAGQPVFFWDANQPNGWASNFHKGSGVPMTSTDVGPSQGAWVDVLRPDMALIPNSSMNTYMFRSVEQFFHAAKATCFRDADALHRICNTDDPVKARRLGREIQGFDDALWKSCRARYMAAALFSKFTHGALERRLLLDTQDRLLVEASPHDGVYGIRMAAHTAAKASRHSWHGGNLLGHLLCITRSNITRRQHAEDGMTTPVAGTAVKMDISKTNDVLDALDSLGFTACSPSGYGSVTEFIKAHGVKFTLLLLLGSFPCQGFSTAQRRRRGSGTDKRNYLLTSTVSLIIALRPVLCIMENVVAVQRSDIYKRGLTQLRRAGYVVDEHIIDGHMAGLATSRQRVFVVVRASFVPDTLGPIISRIQRARETAPSGAGALTFTDVIPGTAHVYYHRITPRSPSVRPGDEQAPCLLTSCMRQPRASWTPHPKDSAHLVNALIPSAGQLAEVSGFPSTWVLPPTTARCTNCAVCDPRTSLAGRFIGNPVPPPFMYLVLRGFMSFFADNGLQVGGVDLFCGSGGSSWGAHRAGLRMHLAIDACQRAVNYYNINDSSPHFDAHARGVYRAPVFGTPENHSAAGGRSSVVVHVGLGDLGVAFRTGTSRSAWRVDCLRDVMDRPGPMQLAGVTPGMDLSHIDGKRVRHPFDASLLDDRGHITTLTFARPPRDPRLTTTAAITAWHGGALSDTCRRKACSRPRRSGFDFCGRMCGRIFQKELISKGAPTCSIASCARPQFLRSDGTFSSFCGPACAAASSSRPTNHHAADKQPVISAGDVACR